MASSKVKANAEAIMSVTPELRRNIRQQLTASAGTKGGSLTGGMKRKSYGSLDIAGTCWFSMVIPSLMFL